MSSKLKFALFCTFFALCQRARAEFIFTVDQVGSNVVVTGSGTLNVSGLFNAGIGSGGPFIQPGVPDFEAGVLNALTDDYYGTGANAIQGPTSLGPGVGDIGIGLGDDVGIGRTGTFELVVPDGYTSGAALSDSATFLFTLSAIGLTPGTYVYTWGSGQTADDLKIIVNSAVPEPGSLILGPALGVLGTVRFLRRRRERPFPPGVISKQASKFAV